MGINSLIENAATVARQNPISTAIGAGVVALGSGVAAGALIGSASKRKNRKSRSKSGRTRDARFKSKQKHERNYRRKRKYKIYGRKGFIKPSKRKGKIHYARKTGQPYIILANGRAKFIKGKRRK